MPRNLEIKARTASLRAVGEIAREIGAQYECEMAQVDTYFEAREGRLKLREVDTGRFELIGYVRDEKTERRESRYEVFQLGSAEPLKSILSAALGVRGVVTKRRTLYRFRSTRIHADEVSGLGAFIEFETEVKGTPEAARDELDALIRSFRIEERDFCRVSYIDLLSALQSGVSGG